jgi:hypothetical protein
MSESIERLEDSLTRGALGVAELFSMRRPFQAPFRQHPLGFIACTLLTEGHRRLRLHFWPALPPAGLSPAFQIHDHLFNFRSWVLSGAVENIEYGPSDKGTEFAIYRTEYVDGKSILNKTTDTVKLIERSRTVFYEGASYAVSAGMPHETARVGQSPAVTVLLTDDVSTVAPRVFGPVYGEQLHTNARLVVSEDTVEAMLASVTR